MAVDGSTLTFTMQPSTATQSIPILARLNLAIALYFLHPPQSPHTSQSMSEVTLSQADSGTVLTLKRGQILILRLDENSTTGYRWSLPALDTEVLQLKSDDINLPSNTGIGGGGQRVFTFEANNPGQVKLQLKNLRDWVGDESTIEQFQVTVQVSEI